MSDSDAIEAHLEATASGCRGDRPSPPDEGRRRLALLLGRLLARRWLEACPGRPAAEATGRAPDGPGPGGPTPG